MARTESNKLPVWAGLIFGAALGASAVGFLLSRPAVRGADEPEPPVARVSAEQERVRELEAELGREQRRNRELAAEVTELREELNRGQRERIDRELEFLNLSEAVASMDLDAPRMKFAKELLSDEPGKLDEPPAEAVAEPDPEEEARALRAEQMARELRALMRAEWVQGMDLLELGLLSEEGWVGPVIFRLTDDRGRTTGNLTAERLTLEGSLSGRLVAILLEGSEERRGGEAVPYPHATRRLYLPGVDPRPWIEALPELFDDTAMESKDDGVWQLDRVRGALNDRLSEDATGDVFHLRHLGGVKDGVLRDVHFAVRDRNGAMLRHLFADRCSLLQYEKGIQVLLEDGVTMRGEARSPFLEGRYRIFLPSARVDQWLRARLPGLVDLPAAPAGDSGAEEPEASESNESTSSAEN